MILNPELINYLIFIAFLLFLLTNVTTTRQISYAKYNRSFRQKIVQNY